MRCIWLQWGHHFAVVDTHQRRISMAELVRRFNGATTLQWWIRAGELTLWTSSTAASMGPPLCSGGYVRARAREVAADPEGFNGATTLQWWIRHPR